MEHSYLRSLLIGLKRAFAARQKPKPDSGVRKFVELLVVVDNTEVSVTLTLTLTSAAR